MINDYVNNQSFCCDNNEIEIFNRPNTQSGDREETAIFFYHPDHLGSTSMVTDHEGRITQNVVYIPFGEVFVEQRDGNWNTPYLFNAKELDEETGMYYYGARYLDPTSAQWLSVDPLWEKYAGMSPYNYCAGNPVKLVDLDGCEGEDATSILYYNTEVVEKIFKNGFNAAEYGVPCTFPPNVSLSYINCYELNIYIFDINIIYCQKTRISRHML